jgi:sulfur transfer complex TusBCD TusB component (DsrH family)
MSKYLLIESRDPFESCDSSLLHDLAQGQANEGNEVTMFLIQNGVLPARSGSRYADRFAELTRSGVTVLADDFSLRERAVRRLAEGVKSATVDTLVTLVLAEGTKTIWH